MTSVAGGYAEFFWILGYVLIGAVYTCTGCMYVQRVFFCDFGLFWCSLRGPSENGSQRCFFVIFHIRG